MALPPREPDRPLTLDLARRVVRAALPSAAADSLEPLGAGWDFDVFVTGDGLVVRFPRHRHAEHLLVREGPILALVRTVIPGSVAVPQVRVLDPAVAEFPYRVGVHAFLRGVPSDEVEPGLRPELAGSVAAALGAIHAIADPAARAAGLTELDREERGRIEWFERGSAGLAALRASEERIEPYLRWVTEVSDPLRRLDAPLRVIHHDLSPEHLLADPATGRLVGILDWTDAILGDAARDFVPLVTFGGWQFADQVLAHYPHRVDAGFRDRLRFMARLLPLMWLGHAYARGEDIRKHMEWVSNAFLEPGGS